MAWSRTFKCTVCKLHRPWFLAAPDPEDICILCVPIRAARLHWKEARDLYPKCIPPWVTLESVLPIYRLAQEQDCKVIHQLPLIGGRAMGLHVPANLQLCPKDQCLPTNKSNSSRYSRLRRSCRSQKSASRLELPSRKSRRGERSTSPSGKQWKENTSARKGS